MGEYKKSTRSKKGDRSVLKKISKESHRKAIEKQRDDWR